MKRTGVVAAAGALLTAGVTAQSNGTWVEPSVLDACPGYDAFNVATDGDTLTAELALAGDACNVFGEDLESLSLKVVYETENRIHVQITDANSSRYEVPDTVFPRPEAKGGINASSAAIQFNYTESPFSFSIFRSSTNEVLFTTSGHPLVFEPQYWRVKTTSPSSEANFYGLGEHTNGFRLDPFNTTRTLWSRDAYGVPEGTNLYGNHPVYFEHRESGSHGVFLLNSNGMDIKINNTENADETTLEYNVVGGMIDLYFLGGSEDSPAEVSKQYAEVVGTPAEVPYWGFGLHQCRFNYTDFVDVAGVITAYADAGIPLETMWTDIDYMDRRHIFTVDADYFPMDRMREVVEYLHDHNQQYIVMTDPAVAYVPDENYGPLDRGTDMDVFLKMPSGEYELGVVWPGVTVYPDWFHPDIQEYWNTEFKMFYNEEDGLDIDGVWIDMNEPASFCIDPCDNPFEQALQQGYPPNRTTSPPDHDTPIFGRDAPQLARKAKRDAKKPASYATREAPSELSSRSISYAKRDIQEPAYTIHNAAGSLSSKTTFINATHANGLVEYDTHNLYGSMMSVATRDAMINRRPGLKPLIITRSTFAGAGAKVGKWLGDNLSTWWHYTNSISGILQHATVYQIPMVGADVCGFGANTTETLCARWATLGAFYPFMRNHNGDTSIPQEFYRWELTTKAAKNALDIRLRLIDYIYTAFHQASLDGTPVLQPLWYQYPKDVNTYNVDHQFFYGPSILVSPVVEENSTSVTYYLPEGLWYDFKTLDIVQGQNQNVTVDNVEFTEIPLHIKGGSIVPLRTESTMTTKDLRFKPFELIIAPDADGKASGKLYLDDGVSIDQPLTLFLDFEYENGWLEVDGDWDFDAGVPIGKFTVLGQDNKPKTVQVNGGSDDVSAFSFDDQKKAVEIQVEIPLTGKFQLNLQH